jgi:chromosome segregation ATPase
MKALHCLPIVLLALSLTAQGQTERSGDANARAMQQLQQLSGERAQLKVENDKLKQEVESLKKQLTTATSGQAALQQKLKTTESSAARDASGNQQNAETVEKLRTQMQELVTRFRETAQSLKEVETDRSEARGQLQLRDRELGKCKTANAGLYQLNTDVLNRLEHQGMFTSMGEKEPFTKIQRTRLENLIDGYKEKATDLRVENKVP